MLSSFRPNGLLRQRSIFMGGIFLLVIGCALYVSWHDRVEVEAQLAQFYPSICLGGWQQPSNATGAPDATAGYTEDTAAVFSDNAAAIYCGEFTGTLPPQTYHTRVTVRFSWQQETVLEAVPAPTLENLNPEENASTTETGGGGSGSSREGGSSLVPTEAVDSATIPPPESPTEPVEAIGEVAPIAPDQSEEAIEPVEVVEPEPEPEPEPEAEPTSEPESVSFWQTIIPTALAQIEVESMTASETVLEPDGELTPMADDAQFMVQYTLDGVTWHTIGYVAQVTSDIRFEIPREVITTMADVSALQIAIVPLPYIDTIPTVYLDSLWLEIGYAPLDELGVHELPIIQPSILSFTDVIAEEVVGTSTASTSEAVMATSTEVLPLPIRDFARRLVRLYGIDDRYLLTSILMDPGQTELWLFDMYKREVHLIGRQGAAIGTVAPGTKEAMVFWIGSNLETVFAYDLRTAGTLHELSLVSNLPVQEEYRLTFPFTAWEVVWRGSELYFFSKETGEVFSDGESGAVVDFLEYFSLAIYLTPDRLREIGGPFVTIPDAPVILSE